MTRAARSRDPVLVTPPRDRLLGVDAARAVALVGMFATHTLELTTDDGARTVTGLLADGRSSALFATLLGVGVALSTPRPDGGRAHLAAGAGLLIRGLLVGLLGLALVGLDPPIAVILAYYGLLLVVAIPLLRLPAWALGTGAVFAAVGTPVLSHLLRGRLLRAGLPDGPGDQADLGSLAEPVELLVTLGLTGYYPVLTWTTYLLAGMAAGRCDLRSRRVAAALAGGGAVLAAVAAAGSALLLRVGDPGLEQLALLERQYGSTPTDTWWWLAVQIPHSGTPFDLAHTTGTALALLGLLLLLGRVSSAALWVPAAVGSVPLTLYTAHAVLLAGYPGDDDIAVFLAHVAGAVVVGALLAPAGRRGPLEQIVSSASRLARSVVGGRPRVSS